MKKILTWVVLIGIGAYFYDGYKKSQAQKLKLK